MDGTQDLSRVLRIPGTYNYKLEPVEMRVLRANEDRRYNPQDLEPCLIELSEEEHHEVNFETNGYDPEGAKALLSMPVRIRLTQRVLATLATDLGTFRTPPTTVLCGSAGFDARRRSAWHASRSAATP